MKRIMLLVLVIFATASAASASRLADGGQAQDGISFEQAVQQGLVPSLDESLKQSGLPLCTNGDEPNQYRSADDLLKAIQAAPEEPQCMADPREARFFADGGPAAPNRDASPSAAGTAERRAVLNDYFVQAQDSAIRFSGSQITCEVTSPSTPNTSTDGVDCDAQIRRNGNGAFEIAGWLRGHRGDPQVGLNSPLGPRVFTTDNTNNAALWNYSIPIGTYLGIRARDIFTGAANGLVPDIFWNGQWQEMTSVVNYTGSCYQGTFSYERRQLVGDGLCQATADVHIQADSGCAVLNLCPGLDLTNGDGIFFNYNYVRVSVGNWHLWDTTILTLPSANAPYKWCTWHNHAGDYYQWTARKDSCS
jgi:hypothetical protein